ncbi:MAG: hypothetical protein ACE15C_03065 [Phycisphaerae bacterium]
MLERKSLLACLLGACVLGLAAFGGCSDSKPRQSARNILDEVATAKRLCDAAVALMVTVPYEVDKQFPPVKTAPPMTGGKPDLTWAQQNVTIPPEGTLNPNAWNDLELALNGGMVEGKKVKGIKAVLDESADAPGDEKAIGQTMMAQVLSLMGDYRLAQSRNARAKAAADLDKVWQTLAALQRQSDLIQTYDALAGLSAEELQATITKAKADAGTLDGQKKASEAQLTKLKGDLDALIAKIQKLRADADNIRLQRETATGPAMLEQTDQANDLLKQAAAEAGNVTKLELAIAQENTNLALVTAKLDEAIKQQKVAQDIINARSSAASQATADRSKAIEERGRLQQALEKAAGDLGKDLDDAAKLKTEAATLYGAAADACTKAAVNSPLRETQLERAAALKSGAVAATSMTDIQARCALAGTQAADLYTAMKLELPPSLANLRKAAADAAAASNDAAQKYAEAARAYETVISALPREPKAQNQKWSYQVQAAAAYAGEYWNLPAGAQRDAALDKAKALLNDAVSGKAASPYLAEAAKLQAQLGLAVTAPLPPVTPTSKPAPTPTSMPSAESAPATMPG